MSKYTQVRKFVVHRAAQLLTLPATLAASAVGGALPGGGPGAHEGREAVRACRRRPHSGREACGGAPLIEPRGISGGGGHVFGPFSCGGSMTQLVRNCSAGCEAPSWVACGGWGRTGAAAPGAAAAAALYGGGGGGGAPKATAASPPASMRRYMASVA